MASGWWQTVEEFCKLCCRYSSNNSLLLLSTFCGVGICSSVQHGMQIFGENRWKWFANTEIANCGEVRCKSERLCFAFNLGNKFSGTCAATDIHYFRLSLVSEITYINILTQLTNDLCIYDFFFFIFFFSSLHCFT